MLQLLARLAGVAAVEEIFGSIRVPLNSSAISAAEYDVGSGALTIDFTDGDSHTYDSIEPDTFVALCTASSPGRYFNANIR